MKDKYNNVMKYAACATTGILLTLCQPLPWRINLGFFAWVALVPLVFAIREKKQSERFVMGCVAGAAHFLTSLYWLVGTLNTYGNLNLPGAVFVALLLVACETAYVVLFALIMGMLMDRASRIPMAAALPFLWVSIEYLREITPFSGFPWVIMGYSQLDYSVIAQSADMGGVWIISFLLALFSGMMVDVLEWYTRPGRSFPRGSVATAVILIVLNIIYGVWRVNDVKRRNDAAKPIVVAALQGNIRQDMKWDENYENDILRRYLTLQKQAMQKGAELIVWPEASTPFALERTFSGNALKKRLTRTGAYTLLGSVDYVTEDGRYKFSNSAYLIGPNGVEGKYSKMHLVPFGEYIPFVKYLGFVDKIVKGAAGNFNAGKKIEVFKLPTGSLSVIICYEAIFGNEVRRFRKEGAELLVNITNDAWFGDTSAPRHHLSMAAFRCIENHCWMIRAANTGISAIIDPVGRVTKYSDVYTETMLLEEVRFIPGSTPYARWGNIFIYSILIVCISTVLWIKIKSGKRVN